MTEVKQDALKALDGMREIVKAEMVAHKGYVSETLCRGHQYCAVGALWVGGGVKPRNQKYVGLVLPGVFGERRAKFLKNKPGLRLAYDALNAAAQAYIDRQPMTPPLRTDLEGAMEQLFEGDVMRLRGGGKLDRPALLALIKSAKLRVHASGQEQS